MSAAILQHLLLVDHDPVGLLQVLLHDRVLVARLDPPVAPRREVGDHLHRPGPVEGDHGDHVLQPLGPELAKGVPHPRRLQLEDAERPRVGQELVGLGVVERDPLRVDAHAPALLDEPDGVGDDGQRPEPQEVHLEEPELLDRAHRVLGDDLLALGIAVERDVLHQGLVGDHHPGRVLAGVAGQPLELLGDLPQLRDLGPRLDRLGEGRALPEGLVQRDVQRLGDELRDLVHVPERHAEHPADVPDDRLRLEHVEGDDLRDPVPAVPLHDVVDDLVAPVVGEVDVHVGHGLAAWVQESLEDQAVTYRIYGRDPEAVGDERGRRRAAPRPHRDPPLLRVPDEVPDHQEVAGELHGLDDAELVVEAGAHLGGGLGIVALEPGLGHLPEIGIQRVAGRHLVPGQAELAERSARGRTARPRRACPCRPRAAPRRPSASRRPTSGRTPRWRTSTDWDRRSWRRSGGTGALRGRARPSPRGSGSRWCRRPRSRGPGRCGASRPSRGPGRRGRGPGPP